MTENSKHQRVSVIMPTFQSERYLLETLQSLANQSHSIDELVVSDDGSSDNTLDIIADFAQSVDFAVLVTHHKASGITDNYLNALANATGDIIIFTDHDDVWLNTKVAVIVDAFEKEDVVLVSHDSLLVDQCLNSLGRTLRGDYDQSSVTSKIVEQSSDEENYQIFLRGKIPLLAHTLSIRSTVKEPLLAKPQRIEQWWFEEWVSCVAMLYGRLELLAEHLVYYRQHQSQTSGGFTKNKLNLRESGLESKYDSRIVKMSYCLDLLGSGDATMDAPKALILKRYIAFLTTRATAFRESTTWGKAIGSFCKLWWSGAYKAYAQGMLSFALDFILVSRLKVSRNKSAN